MPGKSGANQIRYERIPDHEDESFVSSLSADATDSEFDLEGGGKEHGYYTSGHGRFLKLTHNDPLLLSFSSSQVPSWAKQNRHPLFRRWPRCVRQVGTNSWGNSLYGWRRPRALTLVLKSLAIAFMLLGLAECIVLVIGLYAAFFPDSYEPFDATPAYLSSHWPTDYTADIQPFQCHSHNDYWRTVPLKSAIRAGCTGVEADVWLFPNSSTELYVGHTVSSLTPQRTFKGLYIDPLVEILDYQNPNTTLHPEPDSPRNGIFDVDPAQTLVLLVDFKTDGRILWPAVSQQLEPLRQRKYLTHFNGTTIVNGPITVVVTGNAPFRKVVENPRYRDMFFDAPLELLSGLADGSDEIHSASSLEGLDNWSLFDNFEERTYLDSFSSLLEKTMSEGSSNRGQGHSGSAPRNAAIYTPANSYYASVSFARSIGRLFPYPYLTQKQMTKIRQQIAGAHKQGLKVRYWSTPAWPLGLREYVWRVLLEEGADYLNVDDLRAATTGHWGDPLSKGQRWGLDWSPWDRR